MEYSISCGGYTICDTNNDKIIKITNFAIEKINEKNNNDDKFKLNKIVKAECQIVAGSNYKIVFIMNKIDDKRKTNFYCNILVYERSWENYINLDKFEIEKEKDQFNENNN